MAYTQANNIDEAPSHKSGELILGWIEDLSIENLDNDHAHYVLGARTLFVKIISFPEIWTRG